MVLLVPLNASGSVKVLHLCYVSVLACTPNVLQCSIVRECIHVHVEVIKTGTKLSNNLAYIVYRLLIIHVKSM